jgi:hypothetical protein
MFILYRGKTFFCLLIISLLANFGFAKNLLCSADMRSLIEKIQQSKMLIIGEIQSSGLDTVVREEKYDIYMVYSDVKIIASANENLLKDSTVRLYWSSGREYNIVAGKFPNLTNGREFYTQIMERKGQIWRFSVSDYDYFSYIRGVYFTGGYCDIWTEKYKDSISWENEIHLFETFKKYNSTAGLQHFEYINSDGSIFSGNFQEGRAVGLWYYIHNKELKYIQIFDEKGELYGRQSTFFYLIEGGFFILNGNNCIGKKSSEMQKFDLCTKKKGDYYHIFLKDEARILPYSYDIRLDKNGRIAEAKYAEGRENKKGKIINYLHVKCKEKLLPTSLGLRNK